MKKSGKMIPSRRRDPNAKVGYVNFPTTGSTGEGGQLVRLVVLDTEGDKEYMRRFVPCCGGYVSFHLDNCFLGDDTKDEKLAKLGPAPQWDPKTDRGWTAYNRYTKRIDKITKEIEDRYFPRVNDQDDCDKYVTRDFLAVFMLGATGWSGQRRPEGYAWLATYNDLTREGKAFYRSVQKLYPGCELRLLSFLDT